MVFSKYFLVFSPTRRLLNKGAIFSVFSSNDQIYKLNHVFKIETETPFKILRPISNKCVKAL